MWGRSARHASLLEFRKKNFNGGKKLSPPISFQNSWPPFLLAKKSPNPLSQNAKVVFRVKMIINFPEIRKFVVTPKIFHSFYIEGFSYYAPSDEPSYKPENTLNSFYSKKYQS